MTNIFNYRFKEIVAALEAVEKLENKLINKKNHSVTLNYSEHGYWNLRLSITNDQANPEKTRVFNAFV